MSEWKFQDVCRAMLSVLYSNIFDTPPYPTTKFTGQTIIVTGSNCGLGREAARHFVRLDAAKVILAVRSMEKGNDAKSSLEASEKRVGVVEVWHLDLGSYASLKNFAAKAQELERLDVVTENAGIKTEKWVMVEDNESQITVNFVSTFLLGLLLLPKLRGTAERYNVVPRLNIVASFVHLNITKFPAAEEDDIFAALVDENRMNIKDMYDLSKILDVFGTRELASLVSASKKPSVIVNCLDPGFVKTEVIREWTGLKMLIFRLYRAVLARSTEVGSRTLVAAAEAGEESHGQYMANSTVSPVSRFVSDEHGQNLQKQIWAQLTAKLETIQPGILQNI